MTGRFRPLLLFPALIAGLLLAVACGGDDNGKATPSPTTVASATPRGPSPSPTVPPADSDANIFLKEFVITMGRTRARPGTVTFNVHNDGQISHQFVVVHTDIDKAQLPRKPNNAGVDESGLDVVGRIDAIAPGVTEKVKVDVQQGQYVVYCNLFTDGTSHYLQGMYQEFEITPTAPLESPGPTPSPGPAATPQASP